MSARVWRRAAVQVLVLIAVIAVYVLLVTRGRILGDLPW